jgi:hypothetical protein
MLFGKYLGRTRCFVGSSAGRKKEKRVSTPGCPDPRFFQGRYDSNATQSLYFFGFFSPVEIEQPHER